MTENPDGPAPDAHAQNPLTDPLSDAPDARTDPDVDAVADSEAPEPEDTNQEMQTMPGEDAPVANDPGSEMNF
jgi:hypothetical protein